MLRKLPDNVHRISSSGPLIKRMRPYSIGGGRNAIAIRGINGPLFFLVLLAYHIAITFQGLDLLDEGFHAVFYQRIFSDPSSVQYSFFYWLSGIVGGSILKMAPGLGLWGLRLAGAVVSVATIGITYRLLKNYVPRGVLQITIIILALYINTEPKDIQYNTLSALLFFSSAGLMFFGLTRQKVVLLFLSGVVLALNVFTRLPNILGAGMAIAILYDGYILEKKSGQIIRSLSVFIVGFLSSVCSVLLIMKAMGHLGIFMDSIKFLFSLTTTTGKQDGLEGSYSLSRLFYVLVKQHSISLMLVLMFSAVAVVYKFIADIKVKIGVYYFNAGHVLGVVFTASLIWLAIIGDIEVQHLTFIFTGISVLTTLIYITGNYAHEEKLLSLLGLFIMAIHPFGSAPGIMTVMIYSLWINLPMAVSMLVKMAGKDIDFNVRIGRNFWNLFIQRNGYIRNALQWSSAVIVVICLHHIFVFPYFYDKHLRTEMTYSIDNPHMKFIYTSRARATAINELLAATDKYILKGSPVLAFDAIPMYYFMTNTRPFFPNSAPMFYTNQQFDSELSKAVSKNGLPVIVQQQIWTIHEGSSWPEVVVENNNLQETLNNKRNISFYNFITTNKYQLAWSNDVFRILIPPVKY